MTIRVIELKGSATAAYGDVMHTARGNRYSPVPPLLRRLIAEHIILPDDIVEIRRGATRCFNPFVASLWVNYDLVDDPRDGLVRRAAFIGPHVAAVALMDNPSGCEGGFQDERRAAEAQVSLPG